MNRTPTETLELTATVVLCIVVFAAVGAGMGDHPALSGWLREDGPVEWLTVVGLLLLAGLCFWRVLSQKGQHPRLFLWITALWGVAFVFGAGEEISWGQRLLGLSTPEWFAEHNRQGEINLHNLVVQGHDLTKLLFGKILVLGLVAYLLLLPLLYQRSPALAGLADRLAIPVARGRQAFVFVLLAVVIHLPEIPGRESELFELAAVFLILIIFLNPLNRDTFVKPGG
jgi:hypothetical protein